jgi:hypothetical protein
MKYSKNLKDRLVIALTDEEAANELLLINDEIQQELEFLNEAVSESSNVPAGGSTGQVLTKSSNDDFDMEWAEASGGDGGVESFTDLNDVPSDYTNQDGKALVVTEAEDGLEFGTIDKDYVGLGNVDNTSDVDKPVSNATQDALNLKQDFLGFTAENSDNKENTTINTDTTKYPTVNLLKVGLDAKADLSNVLTLDNVTEYIPTQDYHPATRKWVLDLGDFPIIEYVTISHVMVAEKKINLTSAATAFEKTKFSFINGTTQLLGVDYEFLDAQTITWDGLGLDNFIESGDIVLIEYF